MGASCAFIAAWSCTARRTSPSTPRTPAATAASSASGAFLSVSKCMTLSRTSASRACRTRRSRPSVAALRADDGVDHGAHRVALRGELVGDGVDEERGVLGVRLDDGADRRVAVAGERRVEGAHGDVAGAAVGELEQADDLAEQLLGREPGARRGQAAHVRLGEGLHDLDAIGRHAVGDALQELLDQGRRGGACGRRIGQAHLDTSGVGSRGPGQRRPVQVAP